MKLTKEVVEKYLVLRENLNGCLILDFRSLDAFFKSNNLIFGPKLDIDYDNITYYKERE